MSQIEHESASRPQMVVSHRLGHVALITVSIFCLLNCFAFVSLPALFSAGSLWVVLPTMLGVIAASVAIPAGWLAWAPQSGILRVVTVGAAILLSLAICRIGYVEFFIYYNAQFGGRGFFWEDIKRTFRLIPIIIVSMSLPGFLLRIARGWKVEKPDAHPGTTNRPAGPTDRKKIHWLEFAFCLLLLIMSATPIVNFNNWTIDSLILIGMTTPVMFAAGAVVVFPIIRLILGSRCYLRWSILFVSITSLLVGPGIALIIFSFSRYQYPPEYTGPQAFFSSNEFQQTSAFVAAFCITLAAFLVTVRWAGYSLSMPEYVPRKKTTSEKATVHPLDDVE